MLPIGDTAPLFAAMSTQGKLFQLSALRGKIVVLYFFRKAFTRNCTVETKGFRDNYPELKQLGCEVVGVSADEFDTACKFQQELSVTFPMIADADRAISKQYKVMFRIFPVSHRVTYVVDQQGVIRGMFNHEFAVSKHLDEVVKFVRELARPTSPVPPSNLPPPTKR
jgi:peroxiredoxin Q/BCP